MPNLRGRLLERQLNCPHDLPAGVVLSNPGESEHYVIECGECGLVLAVKRES
jgi:hypothetical protein